MCEAAALSKIASGPRGGQARQSRAPALAFSVQGEGASRRTQLSPPSCARRCGHLCLPGSDPALRAWRPAGPAQALSRRLLKRMERGLGDPQGPGRLERWRLQRCGRGECPERAFEGWSRGGMRSRRRLTSVKYLLCQARHSEKTPRISGSKEEN